MREPRIGWIGREEIMDIVDVTTAACTNCGGPARVPEDVLGVIPTQAHDDQALVVVCQVCTPGMTIQDASALMARMVVEMRNAED